MTDSVRLPRPTHSLAATLSLAVALTFGAAGPQAHAGQTERIKDADACGYVVDSRGGVVSEASVTATSGPKTLASTTTLSDGSFHFEESLNSEVVLKVEARGFAPAEDLILRLKPVRGEKKCKSPIYAVLAPGSGHSFLTVKKKEVPRPR